MPNTCHENTLEPPTMGASDQQEHPHWSEQAQQIGEEKILASKDTRIKAAATEKNHDGPERRLNLRKEMSTHSIEVGLLESGRHRGVGQICNISAHGVFVETDATFEYEETHVQMQFRLPDSESNYRAWGRVAHKTTDGLGIAVDILEPDSLASLQALAHYAG